MRHIFQFKLITLFLSLLIPLAQSIAEEEDSINPKPETKTKTKSKKISSYRKGNIRFNGKTDLPEAIYNVGYIANGETDQELANDFLSHNRELLNFDTEAESETFEIFSARRTGVWRTIRYTQKYNDISVYNAELSVTLNDKNEVRMVTSSYKAGVYLEPKRLKPKFSSNDIQSFSANKFGNGKNENLRQFSSTMVIFQTEKGENKLAWKTNVIPLGETSEWETLYDDETGEILLELDKTFDKKGGEIKKKKRILKSGQSQVPGKDESSNPSQLRRTKRSLQQNIDFEVIDVFFENASETICDWYERFSEGIDDFFQSATNLLLDLGFCKIDVFGFFPRECYDGEPIAYVFDPDPLSTSGASYCDDGFCDNFDEDSEQLTRQRREVKLNGLTSSDKFYTLKGPYAQIVDLESPKRGLFSQRGADFRYKRSDSEFEAVNCYYHITHMMEYINEVLGLEILPYQYNGGFKFDPHSAFGQDNSFYRAADGMIGFGEGGVDDGEDADVIIHELGHFIHDALTVGGLSNVEGLSEGFGDYIASSYSRFRNLTSPSDPMYNWVFKWDGHNEFWGGRINNYALRYPIGLSTKSMHVSGQIWSTCAMKIWDLLGREKSDLIHLVALSATGKFSNQLDAAEALFLAAQDSGYSNNELDSIEDILIKCGYRESNAICGDGIVEDLEECDSNIGDATCASVSSCTSGTPTCTSDCLLDYSACEAEESQLTFKLNLLFDNYPEETSWAIFASDGTAVFSAGDGIEYDNLGRTNITEMECLEKDECYTFELRDDADDGLCCSFGQGNYEVMIDSVFLENTNPEFGSQISHTFGNCAER